jgi:O-antigen ligase
MLQWMGFKFFFAAPFLALPWLIGGVPGPVAQLGAWLVAGCVLGILLVFRLDQKAWPQSLALAALVSVGAGVLQFFGMAAAWAPWIAEAAFGEVVANLRQRNQLATLLILGILALVCVRIRLSRQSTSRPRLVVLCSFSAIALLAFVNALTGSRTGLLQLLALLGLAWVWRRSWHSAVRWMLGAACLAYMLGVLLAPWLASLAGHGNAGLLARASDSNAFSRIALWSNVWELVLQKPWGGWGAGSLAYAHYSTSFAGTRFMEMLDNAHNLPLHMAFVFGLPVAALLCAFVGWLIWKNKPWLEIQPDRQLAWGCLMVMGIHSMLEYPLWYGPFFMTAVICVGVLCTDLWRKWLLAGKEYKRAAMILGVRWASKCLGVLLLACTAFVLFDYHRVSQMFVPHEERSAWYPDPMAAAKSSLLFKSHAKFAELQITPLSRETAPRVLELSSELIEWSPEPRIIENLIESATMMELDDLAMFHLQRYRVAYPAAYAAWHAKWRLAPAAK